MRAEPPRNDPAGRRAARSQYPRCGPVRLARPTPNAGSRIANGSAAAQPWGRIVSPRGGGSGSTDRLCAAKPTAREVAALCPPPKWTRHGVTACRCSPWRTSATAGIAGSGCGGLGGCGCSSGKTNCCAGGAGRPGTGRGTGLLPASTSAGWWTFSLFNQGDSSGIWRSCWTALHAGLWVRPSRPPASMFAPGASAARTRWPGHCTGPDAPLRRLCTPEACGGSTALPEHRT